MDEATVEALAGAAGLALAEGRSAMLAPRLTAWLDAANELSAKLAAPEHLTVTPVTVFTHPAAGSEE